MYFANPWGLLALAAIPAIILIHMYHRRFPPLLIAGAHLWTSETRQNLAGRRRERLPISNSLLLELLAALLLSLILSRPHFGGLDQAVHLVVVLDNSASMSGKPPEQDETSFRDTAIAELERRGRQLSRNSVVTLILTGVRPTMLAGPAVPWTEARERLAEWKPTAPRHSFEPAWDLGMQLVEQGGELLFLSDHLPAEKETPQRMEVVSVGRRLNNVAIEAARWTFDSAKGTGHVFLRVQNHGRQPAAFHIEGKKGSQTLFQRDGTLPVDGASSLEADVRGGLQDLVVELASPGDGLALDNRVELVEPKARRVTVANLLPEGTSSQLLMRVLKALPDVQFGKADAAHLVLPPAGKLPESNARQWWLGVGPISAAEEDRKQSKDLAGPYLLEKRHPLLEGVVLGGVVWGGVQKVSYDVSPIVSSGHSPLLSRLNGTRTTAYLLNIDLERSNLGESPDWPILLSNLIELRRDDLPGLQRWNYRLGDDVRFRLTETDPNAAASSKPLTLSHSKHTKPLVRSEVVELSAVDTPGIYEVKDGAEVFGRFSVNFQDAVESDLRNLAPGRREPANVKDTPQALLERSYTWIVMLGLCLITLTVMADWYVLRPVAEVKR